jgi:acetyl-CoA synthetase
MATIDASRLIEMGLSEGDAKFVAEGVCAAVEQNSDPSSCWRHITSEILTPAMGFGVHELAAEAVFEGWEEDARGPRPLWAPDLESIGHTNIGRLISELGLSDYRELHRWSVENRGDFWRRSVEALGIRFQQSPKEIMDFASGVEAPAWLVGARMNIVESCFRREDDAPAIVSGSPEGGLRRMSYGELRSLTNRVANGLAAMGFGPGDPIAVNMPMTTESAAIYLGIVQAGCVVVSIADSFAPPEIELRLKIGAAKGVFTTDLVIRGGKQLPMYGKVVGALAPPAIVLPAEGDVAVELRDDDLSWSAFLSDDESATVHVGDPHDAINILFSSGTTGEPKAIPWDHTTAIKSAVDAYYHHDLQPGNVVAWPTNLGWMMGPWLIFAPLLNRGTIALFEDAPLDRPFGQFIQDARVNMLGLVPSIVRRWRETRCMEGLDWSAIRAFSSTGECSNPTDYFYLMYLAGYRPIIEYCGGTEIGGGYISSTMVQPNAPSTFTTPQLGLDFVILDEDGQEADEGELFIIPPSMGLSRRLLNRDHHEVYFSDTPKGPHGEILRRHGDQFRRLTGGYYRGLGRADDTMNLGGVKISSGETEHALEDIEGIKETAAIAATPSGGGPDRLVIYAVPLEGASVTIETLKPAMQKAIRERLNPLFRIHEVVLIDALPRTASQKVMRRELRKQFMEAEAG